MAFSRWNNFSFMGMCLVDEINFHSWNSIFRNVIFDNNFFGHNILDMFDMQIEFSKIFNKFSKILLIEVVAGGRPRR